MLLLLGARKAIYDKTLHSFLLSVMFESRVATETCPGRHMVIDINVVITLQQCFVD